MDSTVLIIIGLAVAAVVVFLVLRARKSSDAALVDVEPAAPLPEPKADAKPAAEAKKPDAVPATKQPDEAPRPAPVAEPKPAVAAPPAETKPAAAPAREEPAPPPAAPARAEPATSDVPVADADLVPVSEPVITRPAPSATPAVERKPSTPKRDVAALKKGLSQTRGGWVQRLMGVFSGKKELDPEVVTQIEELLLTGDVGVKTTQRLVDVLKSRLDKQDVSNEDLVWATLRDVAHEVIDVKAPAFGAKAAGKPLVVLVVGVNGVGKTTTIGKLASRYKDQGKKVYLAAGDTFRAAAVAQLEAWGKRVGVPVVKGKDLSKPSAVVYDAVQTGVKEGADVVIADTAGRLHTKAPLMEELRKLRDAAGKALPGAPHEILLVLDATTGQNGLIQVKEFRDALDLTGIVLTKLDGTAKGGVILGICDEFKLPVRFVGVGEKVDDLREFNAEDFTEALFTRGEDETEAA